MALFGLPIELVILFTAIFLFGVLFIPLVAYTIGPSLPRFLSEPLTDLLWILSMLGVKRPVLLQTRHDTWEIIRGNKEWTPRRYWTRWAMAPFAIAVELDEDTFRPHTIPDAEIEALRDIASADGGSIVETNTERGAESTYHDLTETVEDYFFVPIGKALEGLQSLGPPSMAIEAFREKQKDEGGDTSGGGAWFNLVRTVTFIGMGVGVGWIIFF